MPVEPNTVSDGESSQASSLASAKSPQSEIQPDRVPGQVGASPAVKKARLMRQGSISTMISTPYPPGSPRIALINRKVAQFVVRDMKPLETIHGEGFRDLLTTLDPRYTPCSRSHILERYIVPMYHLTSEELQKDMLNGVSHAMTTDAWTSPTADSFITTTVHYFDCDTMELKANVLETLQCHIRHTADNLATEVKRVSEKWKMKETRVISDGAANIQAALNKVDVPHYPCFAHTLNLSVNKGLRMPEIDRLTGKVRQLVAVFKQSYIKKLALREQESLLNLQELMLIQDVSTRWNSALKMHKRVLLLMPAVYGVLYSDKQHKSKIPTEEEMKVMEGLVEVQEPFEKVTEKVSAEKVPTSGLILPSIAVFLTNTLKEKTEDSNIIRKVKTAIREDLSSRYKPEEKEFMAIASFLDPRFKDLSWMDQTERCSTHQDVKAEMQKNFGKSFSVKVKTEKPDDPDDGQKEHPDLEESDAEMDSETPKPKDFFDVIFIKHEKKELSLNERIDREFDRYIQEPAMETSVYDIIPWWRGNQYQFPTLANIMMKYLNTPATSVPSERVFSSAGKVYQKRASLTAENANILIFLYHNWAKYQGRVFLPLEAM